MNFISRGTNITKYQLHVYHKLALDISEALFALIYMVTFFLPTCTIKNFYISDFEGVIYEDLCPSLPPPKKGRLHKKKQTDQTSAIPLPLLTVLLARLLNNSNYNIFLSE